MARNTPSRTWDGKRIRDGFRPFCFERWQVILWPRGRRRDYVCSWEPLPPIRFGYFRRSRYGTTLGIFLPALPFVGAWRLIISRHRANPKPRRLGGKDAGANRGADANATGTGRHDGARQ